LTDRKNTSPDTLKQESTGEIQESRQRFFWRNMLRGLIWLAIIVALFIFSKRTIDPETLKRFEPIFQKSWLVYTLYSFSEVIIGIIPPEIFLIWALRFAAIASYIRIALILTLISYTAGAIAFGIGKYLHNTLFYQYLKNRFLQKTEKFLHKYGQYLVLVAALTPVPFSGTAMLVGAVDFPFRKYLLISLSRFLKFAVSAWVIWEANMF
jgi:membrane protein YqaA with SNARE-associated domain